MFERRGIFLEVHIDVLLHHCLALKCLNHSVLILSGLATLVYFNVNTVTGCNLRKMYLESQCGSSRFRKGLAARDI